MPWRHTAAIGETRMDPTRMDPTLWPIGVIRLDARGAMLHANAQAADLLSHFGLSGGRGNLFALLKSAAPDLAVAASQAQLVGASLRRRLRAANGAQVSLTLVREADGALTALLGDEAPLAQAEDEAHRQRARFAAVADWSPRSAIYALDREGRVASWSRSAERLEALSGGEAIGMTLDALLDRTHFGADAGALLAEAARSGESSASGWRSAFGEPSVWVTVSLRAVRGADGALDGFVAVAGDTAQASGREAELRRLAALDPLTGLLNRRAFFDAARALAEAHGRQGGALSVITFDIDHFKALNDTCGHAAGDAALHAMAQGARADLRAGDLLGRLGGDEFAVILPRTDLVRASAIAARLRATLDGLRIGVAGRTLRFTASFGVAETRMTAQDGREHFEQTLARADAALYRAKEDGRNRIAAA